MCDRCAEHERTYVPSAEAIAKVLADGYPPPLPDMCRDVDIGDEDMALFRSWSSTADWKHAYFTDENKARFARAVLLAHIRVSRHVFGFAGSCEDHDAWLEKFMAEAPLLDAAIGCLPPPTDEENRASLGLRGSIEPLDPDEISRREHAHGEIFRRLIHLLYESLQGSECDQSAFEAELEHVTLGALRILFEVRHHNQLTSILSGKLEAVVTHIFDESYRY